MHRFWVDFNEMVEDDLVLLSAGDIKVNDCGEEVRLEEGMEIQVMDADTDDLGQPDNVIAHGKVELNRAIVGWAEHVKWCCRLDPKSFRHESDV